MKYFLILILLSCFSSNTMSKDPHDDNLNGQNLICFNNSLNVDDWGIQFLENKKVKLFSLDKKIYEIYQFRRVYRTDIKNIIILKNEKIEFIINRSRLKFGNKQCKLVKIAPLLLLQDRIKDLKLIRTEGNRI